MGLRSLIFPGQALGEVPDGARCRAHGMSVIRENRRINARWHSRTLCARGFTRPGLGCVVHTSAHGRPENPARTRLPAWPSRARGGAGRAFLPRLGAGRSGREHRGLAGAAEPGPGLDERAQ